MDQFRTGLSDRVASDQSLHNAGAQKQHGIYNGAQVSVIDINSMIADAAEELTEAHSEDREKDVSQREVEAGRRDESLSRLMKLSEVQELLRNLPDMDKDQLERALRLLLQQRASARQLRERAKDTFKDAAHQYALLKALAAGLRERGAPDSEIAAADEALAQLMEEDGLDVRAAFNIAETVADYSADGLGGTGPLRDAYRDHIRDYSSMSSALEDLTTRFEHDDLEAAIQFMTAALAADLDAAGPSIEDSQLQVILDDMHRLKSLTTMKGRCDVVMRTAQRQGARKEADGLWLLKGLVPFADAKAVKARAISSMPGEAGLDEIEEEIRFLNDLMLVARALPEKCYTRTENREKLLRAVQQVIDDAVQREEEEFEED